ncbi:MAG: winged helix-turn-helix transcriptional regulator [Halobellus sp.]|uniref:winged helix-turn-helix transcriptional regulator n=1 Tax=Halobellus sp. TaxID=1979212 RepID=UPI0035D40A99
MGLVKPTDLEILRFLAESGRNNAVNISVSLEKNRSYVNTRLSALADHGLVERVGPAPNSGLYELSEDGRKLIEGHEEGANSVDIDDFID